MDATTQTQPRTRELLTDEEKLRRNKESKRRWYQANKERMAEHARNHYNKMKDDPDFMKKKSLNSSKSQKKKYEEYKQLKEMFNNLQLAV